MSQVKNLRAMFENKGDTSPDRGRSPAGVSIAQSNPAGAYVLPTRSDAYLPYCLALYPLSCLLLWQ